jgi:ribosomal protein L22
MSSSKTCVNVNEEKEKIKKIKYNKRFAEDFSPCLNTDINNAEIWEMDKKL